jgi:hypothetical protein
MLKTHIDIVLFILYLCGNSIGLDGNQIKYSMNPPGEHSVQLVTGGCFFMETIICTKCKIEKPIDLFHKRSNSSFGHRSICKDCVAKEHYVPNGVVIDLPDELWSNITIRNNIIYGKYKISNLGRLKRVKVFSDGTLHYEKLISSSLNQKGYRAYGFRHNQKLIPITIHRMVATEFIPNPENKPCINHKDCNKQNNYMDNLEWVTYSENTQHAYRNNLIRPRGKTVKHISYVKI